MDELTVEVEHDEFIATGGDAAVAGWSARLGDRLREVLGVSAQVCPVTRGSFERTDLKSMRVVDQRELSADAVAAASMRG